MAQIIASSARWDVRADPQKANTKAIAASLSDNLAQTRFAEAKADMLDKLGITEDADKPLVYHMPFYGRGLDVHEVFAALMALDDEAVMALLAYTAAETLECGSAMVEGLGVLLGVDMADHWQPDETFFDLMRDKQAINAMLRDIGGKSVADGNVTETAKTQKQIIRDFVEGKNGRACEPGWQPRYTAFPMKAYTKRGGIGAIDQYEAVKDAFDIA